jgi:excisionase family DNA binding protein
MDNFLTIDELAKKLKVPKSWLYRRTMEKGSDSIPHFKIGKYLRFSEADIFAWIEKKRD